MPNQENSIDGTPRVDPSRPTPDVDRYATDGQSDARGKGATHEQGEPPPRNGDHPRAQPGQPSSGDAGDGPAKMGLTSRGQEGLVAPSSLNEGDRGAADVPPTTSEQLNFDDATEERPRGDNRRTGGTWNTPAHNTGDQGEVGRAPGAGLSNRNGPSDPDAKNSSPVA